MAVLDYEEIPTLMKGLRNILNRAGEPETGMPSLVDEYREYYPYVRDTLEQGDVQSGTEACTPCPSEISRDDFLNRLNQEIDALTKLWKRQSDEQKAFVERMPEDQRPKRRAGRPGL